MQTQFYICPTLSPVFQVDCDLVNETARYELKQIPPPEESAMGENLVRSEKPLEDPAHGDAFVASWYVPLGATAARTCAVLGKHSNFTKVTLSYSGGRKATYQKSQISQNPWMYFD